MVHDSSSSRAAAKHECLYWNGTQCTATTVAPQDQISCYHDGNCNGFGTCRDCTQYSVGGLKLGTSDGGGGLTQAPINLRVYNLRARTAPCCFWDGETIDFVRDREDDLGTPVSVSSANVTAPGTVVVETTADVSGFPPAAARARLYDSSGEPLFTGTYSSIEDNVLGGKTFTFTGVTGIDGLSGSLSVSTMVPLNTTVGPEIVLADEAADANADEVNTLCSLSAAAPWQVAFTEDNPTAYGCNGAKPECPYYTGPEFEEVVDAKMDHGDRVTAKQIMELRYYSDNWREIADPRAEWERRFEQPDIWAWARDESAERPAAGGKFDENSNPMVQRVTIEDFSNEKPEFVVDPPVVVSQGTPTIGGPPSYPTLVRELYLLTDTSLEVVWPANTSQSEPHVRRTFTSAEWNQYISVRAQTTRTMYAVNLTKHPQGGESAQSFIARLQRESPEDVIPAITTALPGKTFSVSLVPKGARDTVNKIRIFLDTGAEDGSMRTADVFVRLIFYHAHVAQTSFVDRYGHSAVDPWINHFTDMQLDAQFMRLTGNTLVHDVLWNTIASNGKKTMYAVEEVKEGSSDDGALSWEPLGCGYIAVTFNDPGVNRVYPWKAWGQDASGADLSVTVDRSGNGNLGAGDEEEITMTLAVTSTKGTVMPPNVAIFRLPSDLAVKPFDIDRDVVRARYAYTEYKQGPINAADIAKLKFKEDVTKVIDQLVYDITYDQSGMEVSGVYLRVGEKRVTNCEQVIGDCYTEKALENEARAQTLFFAGGIGEEGELKSHTDMVNECAAEFNQSISGVFEDGTPVSYNGVVNRLTDVHLSEGDQKYSVVFSDELGRPIGTKNTAFLLQSATVQTRDVEIRYKWSAHLQHYPTNNGMILLAILYGPTFATQDRLIRLFQEYDPTCGDHAETTAGNANFRAFDINIDKQGPLWYPYKRCLIPKYHGDSTYFDNVVEYTDTVEGFEGGYRRYYWERMRFFDQYMPAIMGWINLLGCFWTERTTTANVNRPVIFTGYTKVRSSHPFGMYATDRESLRISRHWQKRNLSVREEVTAQEDGGLSVRLTDDFTDLLYDVESGELKTNSDLETPVWVHVNDGISVVKPATEDFEHPFGHLLMNRTGSFTFQETFQETRVPVSSVFEERDYTSTLDRSEDGTKVYLPDGTELNVVDGYEESFVEHYDGSDVRWVYKNAGTGWAWMAEPDDPVRGSPRVTGLYISNPGRVLFKKNFEPATHALEGAHTVTYTPHKFDKDGGIEESAKLQLDGGPELYISQTDGQIFILADPPSPYDPLAHQGTDYTFALHGNGPSGVGILADNRGLQFYEAGGAKYATLAGININVVFNLDELPYESADIRDVGHLTGDGGAPDLSVVLQEAIREYTVDERTPVEMAFDFKGHYYVESVRIVYAIEGAFDFPVVRIEGVVKETGMANILDADDPELLFVPTSYVKGQETDTQTTASRSFNVNSRLFRLRVSLGSRLEDRQMRIENIVIKVRNPVERSEVITVQEPRVQTSTALVGTHKPSDLEFYFQRSYPNFAKDYLSGQLSTADVGFTHLGPYSMGLGYGGTAITKTPGTEIKFTGRQVKDIIPQYEFTDLINNRFPYNNIDITAIDGYVEATDAAGVSKYINAEVFACSKGWTMATTRHYGDPLSSLIPTDTGPGGIPNVFPENKPVETLQAALYDYAGGLLGDKVSEYVGFWHPAEIEFFANVGVILESFAWKLTLRSTVAPINRVYRHQNYGCNPETTNENLDGYVHEIANWQAKGVFHYLCDARFSWACLTTVMNKCNEFIFDDYGQESYLSNDVIGRFTYTFAFPPRAYSSWQAAGLINQNEIGGIVGGTGPVGSAAAASVPAPTLDQLHQTYNTNLPPKGPGPYQ